MCQRRMCRRKSKVWLCSRLQGRKRRMGLWFVKFDFCFDISVSFFLNLFVLFQVQVDTAQILLKQLPGLGRFGVVCASDSFDAVIANETCRQMGQGWAESYGSVPLQASHLPWVQMQQSALWSSWYDPISHISTANLSLAEDSMSEFKKRIKLTNECPNQLAQTITCASFECSSGSSTRYTNSAKTGTPNDVQSLVRIRVDSSDGRSTECLAQLISPDWLLSSAECLE